MTAQEIQQKKLLEAAKATLEALTQMYWEIEGLKIAIEQLERQQTPLEK